MAKYPSLYATLEPATGPDGRRGATVRCTATRRDLGFVWWSCAANNVVTWHFRMGETTGERTTERNAVQSLRDLANGQTSLPLRTDNALDARAERAARTTATINARPGWGLPVTSAESQHYIDTGERPTPRGVVWGDVPTDAADLTSAIGAALKRHQGSR